MDEPYELNPETLESLLIGGPISTPKTMESRIGFDQRQQKKRQDT